jgi:hypothetical protein
MNSAQKGVGDTIGVQSIGIRNVAAGGRDYAKYL